MPAAQDRVTTTTAATAPNQRPIAATAGNGGAGSAAGSASDARAADPAAFDVEWLVRRAMPDRGRVLGPRAA